MKGSVAKITFRPLRPADLETLHDWLGRPHVSQWWGEAPTLAEVEEDYLPYLDPEPSPPHGPFSDGLPACEVTTPSAGSKEGSSGGG